jgi:hypothetical protein
MIRRISTGFYKPPTESQQEEMLEQRKQKSGKKLKWRRVDFSFIESKISKRFIICSKRDGQSARYKFARYTENLIQLLPWTPIGPPSGMTWEYSKDDNCEYMRMLKVGRPEAMVRISLK